MQEDARHVLTDDEVDALFFAPEVRELLSGEIDELEAKIAATDPYPFVDFEYPDGTIRAVPKYDDQGNEMEYRWREGRLQRVVIDRG